MKNVATQKETNAAGPDNRSKIVLLVDASQQTGKAGFFCAVYVTDFYLLSCIGLIIVDYTTFYDARLSPFPATS